MPITIPTKPMLDAPEVQAMLDLLAARIPQRVLEWGGGGTTVTFPQLLPAAQWVTIESDEAWYTALRQCDRLSAHVILLWLKPPEYHELARHRLGLFDLIIVDGAPKTRPQCLSIARSMLTRNGAVWLHDASHPPYQDAARANFGTVTELVPPNASGKRGVWLLQEPL